MAVIIKTNNTHTTTMPANGEYFTLEELQGIVGGYIEIVSLGDDTLLVINEEGKLLDLPYNALATNLYSQHYGSSDYIVGDVLWCENKLIR